MSTETKYDAIVIGSGITGGWAAKELTERGLRVLVLERGEEHIHGQDYIGEHVSNPKLSYGGMPHRRLNARDYSVQSRVYAFDESTRHHFINDRENPYVTDGDTPFEWVRGAKVGGRSLTWGRQSYRWGPQDFEANAIDGHGIDWPIRYTDLEDWYTYVEKFAGISGQAEGLWHFPDSAFQPPMEFNALDKIFKRRLASARPELTYTIGRAAILTEDLEGRAACHYCGPCPRGCATGSYFSSQASSLPAAEKTGRMTLRPDSLVERLGLDRETGRISHVSVIDTKTREKLQFTADLVFLCASTIATTQILLNSAINEAPDGLANSSGVVGKYLMDHTNGMTGLGVYMDALDRYEYGYRPNGTYIPRFRNLDGQDADADFIRGYGFQNYAVRLDWRESMHARGMGREYKERLRKPGLWAMALNGFGECLPRASNRVSLDPGKRDIYGVPQAKVTFDWSDNEREMRLDMGRQAEDILKATGAVFSIIDDALPATAHAIHEMGTVRMGLDRKTSALNGWNQSHDHPNLFVTDGAAMTSSAYVNPSLTYMAMTARAAAHAADLWNRNAL